MRVRLFTVGLIVVLPLTGCIFPPQILDEGPGGVSVRMNGFGEKLGNSQQVADNACGDYAAAAEFAGTESGFGDGTVIHHYRCVGSSSSLGLASADGLTGASGSFEEDAGVPSESFADRMQRAMEKSMSVIQ